LTLRFYQFKIASIKSLKFPGVKDEAKYMMFHLHMDKFEIKSVRIDNRTCIGSILDHRRADNDGTLDKRKSP
jgi:hypothetical protein